MYKREFYINQLNSLINTDFIKIIVGIRRCGKTYLLKSFMEELRLKGVDEKNIIYISFESVKYKNIFDANQLDEIILSLTEGLEGKIYLLFDEIQQVESWEKSVNAYRVDLDADIYITGSNSKLLSGELATFLSGRYITINIYPFSFKEFYDYHKLNKGFEINYESKRRLFNEYLCYGGMPSLLSIKDNNTKLNVLSDIHDSIIINILSRYKINEINLFSRFVYFMMNSVGQTFSKTSITNYLRNENKKTSRNTISNYTKYIEDSLFCKKVRRQDILGKKILKTGEKYYLTDHGFHHALVDDNTNCLPRIIENIVFNELLRRNYNVKIGKIKNKEIDFVCQKPGKKVYLQVSYLLSTNETVKREFAPLLDVPDKYDTYVLSMDEYDFSHEGIKHKNIIDFLLDDEI